MLVETPKVEVGNRECFEISVTEEEGFVERVVEGVVKEGLIDEGVVNGGLEAKEEGRLEAEEGGLVEEGELVEEDGLVEASVVDLSGSNLAIQLSRSPSSPVPELPVVDKLDVCDEVGGRADGKRVDEAIENEELLLPVEIVEYFERPLSGGERLLLGKR